jgi:hypothetical protein
MSLSLDSSELKDKLSETLAICEIHHQRMWFAWQSIRSHFPLTVGKFGGVSDNDLALFDQVIYRFSKLQDCMGSRLFKQLLQYLQEDVDGLPFIDILNRMEKLFLLDRAQDWIELRQTRNVLAHEYPFDAELQVEELNLLTDDVERLASIWIRLKDYAQGRMLRSD